LPVPGPAFVGTNIRADNIYPNIKIDDLQLDSLRTTFANKPAVQRTPTVRAMVTHSISSFVESKQNPIVSFAARGWHLARQLDVASAIDTARAFIFRDEFLTSPVSPLFAFGRKEDLALQKARSTISQRVHARFWLTPYTFEGGEYGSDR
jgi:hypothetical protein